jgi:hypothetical protein
MKKLILSVLIIGLWSGMASAQSPWMNDIRTSSITLEWDKPKFDDRSFQGRHYTGTSSALFISGNVRITDNLRFVGEIPISHAGNKNFEQTGETEYSTVLGNIYTGGILDIDTGNPGYNFYVQLGVRIPTIQKSTVEKIRFGSTTGRFSEYVDRGEAFDVNIWAIPLSGHYIVSTRDNFDVKFRLGTVYNIYTGEFDWENELYLLYGLIALYRFSAVEGHLGFSGRNRVIGNDPDFVHGGFTQIRGGISVPFGHFVPGIFVKKPLGENFNRLIDYSYGFSLEIRI